MLSGSGRLSSQALSLVPQVRTNALRFGPDNVTVNTVIPGIVESEAWDKCGTEVRRHCRLIAQGVRQAPGALRRAMPGC